MKFHVNQMACALTLCLVLLCCFVSAPAQESATGPVTAAETSDTAKINLNSATAEQLASLPGIGPATAKLIIEHRTNAGKFSRIEEILNIKGIGEKKFQSIKDLITV